MATNKWIGIGNLTTEPEQSMTTSGMSCCKFQIAVSRNAKNKNGGHDVDFIPITAWGALADNCARFLHKGNKVCVVGELQIDTFTGKDGYRKSYTKISASEVEFLFTKNENEGKMFPAKAEGEASIGGDTAPQFDEIPTDDSLPF